MTDRYTWSITGVLSILILALLGIHLTQGPATTAQAEMEGMNMSSNAHYQVSLTTQPGRVDAGQPFNLTLSISDSENGAPVTQFDEVHTKLLHLILVSEDLSQFLHVHPDYTGDGVFVLNDAVIPAEGNYAVFADFTPMGEHAQVVRLDFATDQAEASMPRLEVEGNEFTAGPLTFSLELPELLNAGVEQRIKFHIHDAETGEPVDTLDEYLGAGGHLVIVDEASDVYLHTHPADHEMEAMEGMTMTYGPELEFLTEFPGTGSYKMWLQVQYQGEVYTAPFVVEVSGTADTAPETTPSAGHGHG